MFLSLTCTTTSYYLLPLPIPFHSSSEVQTDLFVLSRQKILHNLTQVVKGGSLLWLTVPALHHDLIAGETQDSEWVQGGIPGHLPPHRPSGHEHKTHRMGEGLTLHW